ncbi:SNF5-domain-containing protein, partial [Aureobasidium melanogenum]
MSAFSLSRTESPQAFVSSFAPRVRTYQNSLLTPAIQPQNAIPPLRTTKRGTTAINYSEDFENDSLVEDSDAPRRPTGLRSLRQNESQTVVTTGPVQSTELTSAVDVQGIWREWMGKPKKAMTERQVMLQAQLPLNLVPIRIDLSVSPFQPEAPLPKPNNARELGVDENSPAYKAPDMTPEFRIKDSFLWNLHEALMTPDQFAKVFVDELDFPLERRPALAMQVSQQIRTQLEEHAAVVMHPLFNPTSTTTTETRNISTRPPISREISSTPFAQTPSAQQPQTNGVNTPNAAQTPLPNDANVSAVAQPLPPSSVHNPDDAHRCIISLSINLMNRLYTDKFEWSLMHPAGFPEIFAKQTCADLGLSGEWVPALAHAIYEAVLKLKKEYCENNGSLLAVIGSGIDAWGQIDNEAAEVHGDGSLAIGEAAGWRFDNDDLGAEWQPRVEVLSKDEIEKREGDRERQIRRQRREMAARANAGFAPPPALANDYFGSQSGAGDEERMGRGERSKKKRRFRSLSPTGRETPDFTAAFGGEQGKLTESERPVWQCSHCRIGGNAVWAVRDGPSGPRSLCNNCGLLYERDKRLPPWAKDLYLVEQPKPSRPDPPPHAHHHAPLPHTPSGFIPNPHRLIERQTSQNGHNSPQLRQHLSDLPDAYAATVRGGGPSMFEDYAVEGEDLDWTKVTDPRERKRLQNIINGRKYRERRLAAEAAAAAAAG